jgi:E3 ubiquitin-protein ligase RNF13
LIDIIIIVIVSPLIMLIFIYVSWRIKLRVQRKRELAPISVVSRLDIKIFQLSKEKEQEEEESCAICLEEYQSGNELRLLPCNHQFHALCVDAWLTTQKKLVSSLVF